MEEVMRVVTNVVPLVAGIGLVFTCAQAFIRNPAMSHSHAMMLAIGAMLCVAPTLASLQVKAGGFEVAMQQIEKQGAQLKGDFGEQGAQLKRDLVRLKERVDALQQRTTVAAAGSAPVALPAAVVPPPATRDGIILIFYAQPRKDLALKIEDYLLRRGYSANAVFTDFSEISVTSRGPDGSASLVYTGQKQPLADDVKKELRRFADVGAVTDQVAQKLSAADVQLRLF